MPISSRTPEGDDNRCPICRKPVVIEPSRPPGDAPCPHCGYLLWFGANSRLLDGSDEELSEREVAGMLTEHPIPPLALGTISESQIFVLFSESMARANTIVPIAMDSEELWVAVARLTLPDELQRTLKASEFLLDRDIRLVQADAEFVREAIERYSALGCTGNQVAECESWWMEVD